MSKSSIASRTPVNWRSAFTDAVYNDLAADNQDVPLEEYPARILSILDMVLEEYAAVLPADLILDAQRYRWLKNQASKGYTCRIFICAKSMCDDYYPLYSNIDNAIDVAAKSKTLVKKEKHNE